jgi:hypothetical protein
VSEVDWDVPVTVTMRRGNAAAVAQAVGYANNASAEAQSGAEEITAALAEQDHPALFSVDALETGTGPVEVAFRGMRDENLKLRSQLAVAEARVPALSLGRGDGERLEQEFLRLARDQREIADAGGIPNRIEAARAAQAAYENAADLVHSQRPENGGAVLTEAIEVFERRAVEANEGARRHPKTEIGHQFTSEAGIWRVASRVLRDLAKHLGDGGQEALASSLRDEIEFLRDAATAGEGIAASDAELDESPATGARACRRAADRLEALLPTQPVPSCLSEEGTERFSVSLNEQMRDALESLFNDNEAMQESDGRVALWIDSTGSIGVDSFALDAEGEWSPASLSASSDTGGAGATNLQRMEAATPPPGLENEPEQGVSTECEADFHGNCDNCACRCHSPQQPVPDTGEADR